MRIHRDHAGLPAAARGASVAIGNFDGVHRGHREVIRVAAGHAARAGPPARAWSRSSRTRARCSTPPPRPAGSRPCAARPSCCAASASSTSTSSAATDGCSTPPPPISSTGRLLGELEVAAITTGRDFRFGHRRQGDVDLLAELAGAGGRPVTAVEPVTADGDDLLLDRHPHGAGRRHDRARQRAARPPLRARGRRAPWRPARAAPSAFPPPTSIRWPATPVLPGTGVYAVDGWPPARAAVWSGVRRWPISAAARPSTAARCCSRCTCSRAAATSTASACASPLAPALRGERKFSGIDELKAQIARDCEQARAIHAPIPA